MKIREGTRCSDRGVGEARPRGGLGVGWRVVMGSQIENCKYVNTGVEERTSLVVG